jgi:pyridinium-3,5-biscarboxylic acid mononucleotide sulfurtransferase
MKLEVVLDEANPLARLRRSIGAHGSMLVAYSGGVDSTLVLKVAHDVLAERSAGLLAVSESLPESERKEAVSIASEMGVRLHVVQSHEMDDSRYRANPDNRCYFCKSELFGILEAEAKRLGYETLAYGANVDDQGDFRPGMTAAREHQVAAPLIEAGLGKEQIRALARELGLPNWDKPARACLSSRIPHGIEVTSDKLRAVERAEAALSELGFRQYRVRWHDEIARIELGVEEMARLADPLVRERVVAGVKQAGFRFATIDLEGYRQGSLNPPLLQIG